ncbi:MAG: hypothetical protein HRT90_08360 [Candidatus Margulisbacteria bacterium]|nr:hypothetical protein [Candidatus Margulisiibacteriota bacterium]
MSVSGSDSNRYIPPQQNEEKHAPKEITGNKDSLQTQKPEEPSKQGSSDDIMLRKNILMDSDEKVEIASNPHDNRELLPWIDTLEISADHHNLSNTPNIGRFRWVVSKKNKEKVYLDGGSTKEAYLVYDPDNGRYCCILLDSNPLLDNDYNPNKSRIDIYTEISTFPEKDQQYFPKFLGSGITSKENESYGYLVFSLEGPKNLTLCEDEDMNSKLYLAGQCLKCVAILHDHNIANRDIGEEDLVITPENTVKLIDFGHGIGKSASPEELSKGKVNDRKDLADIFREFLQFDSHLFRTIQHENEVKPSSYFESLLKQSELTVTDLFELILNMNTSLNEIISIFPRIKID